MRRILPLLALLSSVTTAAVAGGDSLQQMYINSFIDPVAFENYIEGMRSSLATNENARCLNKIGSFTDNADKWVDNCLVRGEPENALVCLNENPQAAAQVWSRSLYDSIFKRVPWTETIMGRTGRYNQLSSRNLSAGQNEYLLARGAKFLSCN